MLNPEGSNTGYGAPLQGPGCETGCSHGTLLNPRLSSAVSASAHHGVQPHWARTGASRAGAEGAGCTRWGASTAPGAGGAAQHCWHRSRRDTPRAAHAAGWARGTAASHLGLQSTSPAPPAPQCLVTPPGTPGVAVTCSVPSVLDCGAVSIVLQPPAQRRPAPLTVMPSSLHGSAIPPAPGGKQGAHRPGVPAPPQSRHWGQALLTLVAGKLQAGVQAGCRQMHCV